MKESLVALGGDVRQSVGQWRLWLHLGWNDIATQYRRSFIGPVWITLSTGLFVIAFGMLGAQIFSIDVANFLPYFATGFIVFTFFSSLITEGCQAFISSHNYLKHSYFPRMTLVFRVMIRNLIMLAHNAVIILITLLWFDGLWKVIWVDLLMGLLLAIVAFTLVVAILSTISSRFRDIPLMMSTLMQITFFLTPVFWQPNNLSERAQLLVTFNPFAIFLDLLRDPILGVPVRETTLHSVFIIILLLILLFVPILSWSRKRIVYWV